MPPTGAASRVKDPEYSNWLKVSLALYYLTVGLHSFIQGEVDALHQFLLQKLYRGSGVPKPQCSICKSKDVKQNRNTYVWKFKSSCPSHLCDTWLAELLTLHINPTSNKIYWDNCDVTAWPFVPWECAKLYMPRGQLPANTGPVKCDSHALLTLMANCKYLHGKLSPAGLRLTHTVSKIRNSVMHSKDMRLSDGDSKSFIQDIISLLEDPTHLKSLEECKLAVNEINKIDNDSLDVSFNVELEIIALRTAVDGVRQDMGKHGTLGSVESLGEEYIKLKEEMRTMIDTVENRIQGTVIPAEILNMDDRSIQLFENALKDGKVKVYSIRVMVIGHQGVGKTTLIKRLLGKDVNISERQSTEGIDVHLHCCDVSISSHEWILQKKGSEQDHLLQQVANVLKEQIQVRSEAADEKLVVIPQEGQKTDISTQDHVAEDPNLVSPHPDLGNLPKSNTNIMVRSEPGKNVSSESRTMDSNIEFLQFVQENADKIKPDLGKYAPFTMWDFAGHHAFYTTHQMFLSRRAIYLLVSNISKRLDDTVKDECYIDEKGKMECTVRELVEVWMNSVHCCAPPDNEIMNPQIIPPPVILVGTHADAIQQDNRPAICENYFREIRSHLHDKPSSFHLVEEEFAIDNTVVDSKLEGLKRKIVEVASRQKYWGETIPASWLPLEQVLMNLRAKGCKVINRSLLENKNQAGGVQISTDQLDLFLRYQHEIGNIIYFSKELLKEKIVLEPQWMINALKSLITVEEMFVLRHARSVATLWYKFKNDGILSPELIDALWTKENNPDLHDNKDHILLLMEQLNIITKPKLYIDGESEIKEVDYFFAPCMLHEKPPREVIFPEHHEQMESSSVMCYVFTGKFLPVPIFHRLLAACVAQWPLATKNTGTKLKNQIFGGCGVFRIGHLHKLTLHILNYIIFMRVTKQGIKDKTPSSKLCIEVKEFIAKVLNKLIGYLGHSLKFEEFIQCPYYNGEIVDCLIRVDWLKKYDEVCCDSHGKSIESKEILKFWFDGEVKNTDCQDTDDVDSPITQEHINHLRLFNALTNVCSNALREILLTNVPTPHTDIYKAILANQANLKKKLNKEQFPLVFPDPQGLSTGEVEQFDISLLYIIIRNVSSVPDPSNDWGKPPADNPRDTTLRANVDRIRSYRNHIVGHNVHGKISQQEFEDYWAKIDKVLGEIENVIGNHGYLKDLEDIKNQAFTTQEAHELQKKFQEYKRKTNAAASDIMSILEESDSAGETARQKVKEAKSLVKKLQDDQK